jgi:DNA primase
MTNFKISSHELEILRAVPAHAIINERNNGRNKFMKCPFHNERTASFVLFPDGGYKCFGCSKHGRGALDFCMDLGCDFKQAVEEVLKHI